MMFRQWRHLLLVIAELHKLGYECARIVPWIEDTAGGGDWTCIVAPAAMISPAHGAEIDEHIDWWGGACPPGRDFPYLMGRAVLPGMSYWPRGFDSAENMIKAYPTLAEKCLGRDREYVEWYRNMLQSTEPDGVIFYGTTCWDHKDSPINRTRVLAAAGELDVVVPLPPLGKYQLESAAREAPVLQEAPRITSENVDRIRPGMASSDVRSILGDGRVVTRGESVERSGGNSVRRTTAVLDWQEGSRRVTVTFENDKVLEVHQRGLE
jgi:hypothetical protein